MESFASAEGGGTTSPESPGIVKHGPWNPAGLTTNNCFRMSSQKLREHILPRRKVDQTTR
jgi:hypothetical protein